MSAIRPTVTQRVRGFLSTQGVDVKPWAPLDETHASLYRLMSAKREDAEFWGPVQRLLGEIVEDAAGANGRLPAPQAELLKGWDIEELVRDLRRALPSETPSDSSAFKRFSAGLSAPVLGGFLLLGLAAAGCDGGKGDDDTASDTDATWAEGCSLDPGSTLWGTIHDAADLTDAQKADLCACFADLSPSWEQGLAAAFESASAEDTAAYLEAMIQCCEYGIGGDYPSGMDPTDFCAMDTSYKGVSFPESWGR
jgi:hypothetical protein